jgi:hypothetical protein
VAAKISQQKKLQVLKDEQGICNVISVQLATIAEYSPNNRHQTIASSIHGSPLLQRKELGPHVYRRSRSVDNLQKNWFGIPVKHNIITTISYCPN